MNKMPLRIVRFLSVAIVSMLTTYSATAETFSVSHWAPPQHPLAKSLAVWGKLIEEKSGGSIKVSVFPSSQLGAASDHYDMAKDGIADAAWLNPGFSPGRWPVSGLGEIFMLIKDPVKGSIALSKWYAKYAEREMPEVKVCLMHTITANTVFSVNKEIKVPSDMKGMRVRPSGLTQAMLVKASGGTTVLMPYPKIREPLERGVIDATFGVPHSLVIFGGGKKIRFGIKAPLSSAVWVIAINKVKYDGMSSEHKKVIDSVCTPEQAVKMAAPTAGFEKAGWGKLEEMGVKFHTLSATEKDMWRKARKPGLEAWKKSVSKRGYNAEEVYQELIAALKSEGALDE